MIRRHAVVYMCHAHRAIGDSHQRLLIRRAGMSHADYYTVLAAVFCQSKFRIVLRSHRDIFDHAMCGFLIHFKLFYGRFCNRFRGLCTLVFHIQIRSFEMDPQNLCTLVAFFHNLCDICNRFGQNLRHLSYGCRKNRGNAFFRNPSHPVAQTFRLAVVGIESISTMRMHVNKTGNNPLIAVIHICSLCPKRIYIYDFSIGHFQLSGNKLSCQPNSSAL